ncbi:hypothetical protein CDD82_6559 [Ophiocordyceps australis]|uniref:Uncharacterized protein n=1 Tax=Ophiocordyceps australis TaxID=1399860 RepID=A0A2C5YUQ5_9HYPO|nr:hypothetical protein CDD82_6559 [Ophiocordyceps australis]
MRPEAASRAPEGAQGVVSHLPDRPRPSLASSDGDATLAESIPPSPRQPPAYGDDRAPAPPYEEIESEVKARQRAKERQTVFIRLLTSVFVTVLVALIVAAVVVRIQDKNDANP